MASPVTPLFPLNTVLFPGGPLPLRIFEARYVDMVRHCMRAHCPFGVVLIRAGWEVGAAGAGEMCAIGTTARIVDFNALPDGLLGITCIGERKFSVSKHWQQDDGQAILKRLLVASMACVLAWRLGHSQAPQADEARRVVMSLSGRQLEYGKSYTLEGLLAGIWVLLAMTALLERMPQPTAEDVKAAISGHICRCGSYPHVVEALLSVGKA